MPLPKSDAEKLIGKNVTVRYTQNYTNGRSEELTQSGKVTKVTDHSIELFSGYTSLFGTRSPVFHLIGLAKISEVK